MAAHDLDLIKTVADLRELGATCVKVEITRGGTLQIDVVWEEQATKRHEWRAK